MPEGGAIVLFIAMALGGAYYGGKATYTHAIKPAAHVTVKAAKATGCGVKKAATLGHKNCGKVQK